MVTVFLSATIKDQTWVYIRSGCCESRYGLSTIGLFPIMQIECKSLFTVHLTNGQVLVKYGNFVSELGEHG